MQIRALLVRPSFKETPYSGFPTAHTWGGCDFYISLVQLYFLNLKSLRMQIRALLVRPSFS